MTTLDDNIDNDAVGKHHQSNRMEKKKLKIIFLTSPQFTSQYSRKVTTEELPSGAVSHLCFRQRSSVDVHTNSFSKKCPVVLPSHMFVTEKK